MRVPKKLKIGAHIYRVQLTEFSDDTNGDHDSRSCVIRISKHDHPSQQGATFIHEVMHALNATLSASETGHALLESLSQQLYQVLSDNKLLK